MPIRWGAPPETGIDRNPTPFERIVRQRGVILGGLGVLLVLPVVLVLLWVFLLHGACMSLFGVDPLQWMVSNQLPFSIFMMLFVLFVIIHLCAAATLAERKLSAFIQDRNGPDRVGWFGALQPVVDGAKFILKEDIIPKNVDKPLYLLAPCIAFVVALSTFVVVPWAGLIVWPWADADGNAVTVTTQAASLDIGVLYMLALGSLSVYGVVLAGWASNNKYSHYGGMRAAAQMLSYEVPLGLGVLVVILLAGSLRMEVIQDQQTATGIWNVFLHPIMFFIVLVTIFAETNRAPFDLAECEQELIGGFHTEYSSMKFALFFLAEYAHMTISGALLVSIFLGGWEPLPFLSIFHSGSWLSGLIGENSWLAALLKFGVFWGKVCGVLFFFMVVRWTIPRFRFDQLMGMAWKGMIPVGMVLIVVAGAMVATGMTIDPAAGVFSAGNYGVLVAHLIVNAVLLAGILMIAARSRKPVTGRQDHMPDVEMRTV